jgi:hypothetical protein
MLIIAFIYASLMVMIFIQNKIEIEIEKLKLHTGLHEEFGSKML